MTLTEEKVVSTTMIEQQTLSTLQETDLTDLRKNSLQSAYVGAIGIILLLLMRGGYVYIQDTFEAAIWFFSAIALGGMTWVSYRYYQKSNFYIASVLFIAGLLIVNNILLLVPNGLGSYYPFISLLIVAISGFLINPLMAFGMVLLCFLTNFLTVGLYWGFLYEHVNRLFAPIGLALLMAFITWSGANSTFMAYNWAIDSRRRAAKRRDELFDSQQQLKKMNQALETANLRLAESERKLRKAYAVKEALVEELQELNASKDKFFSIVAHDLRGPFQPLLGLTQVFPLIIEKGDPEEMEQASEAIYQSAQNVFALLNNLLEWSRLQMDRITFEPVTFDLHEATAGNIIVLEDFAADKDVTLANQVPKHSWVHADKDMTNTIIRNLTSNAIKFTPTGGCITLSVHPATEDDFLEFWVADNGVGIRAEDKDKLFQVDTSFTTQGTNKERGTGLGLIMCKEMVEKNSGEIWVESELGVGTTMKFTLPQGSQAEYITQSE